jgi:uncharacterized protein (TIGR02145 family)
MAENLNYIPDSGNSWCYENAPANCDKYGRLYDWETANAVCPDGWHLPTSAEWSALVSSVGGSAGTVLKASGTDTYGFSALMGGTYRGSGGFEDMELSGNWWSATGSSSHATDYYMQSTSSNVNSYSDDATDGFSVRCVATENAVSSSSSSGNNTPILDTPHLANSAPYKIYNLQGTMVRKGYGNANLNSLTGGVYLLRTGSQTKTIVVR